MSDTQILSGREPGPTYAQLLSLAQDLARTAMDGERVTENGIVEDEDADLSNDDAYGQLLNMVQEARGLLEGQDKRPCRLQLPKGLHAATLLRRVPSRDWRFAEAAAAKRGKKTCGAGSDLGLTKDQERPYALTVEFKPSMQQLFVSLEATRKGQPSLDLMLEVNNGVPDLHISATPGGDNVAHLQPLPDGRLRVVTDSSMGRFERADGDTPSMIVGA